MELRAIPTISLEHHFVVLMKNAKLLAFTDMETTDPNNGFILPYAENINSFRNLSER